MGTVAVIALSPFLIKTAAYINIDKINTPKEAHQFIQKERTNLGIKEPVKLVINKKDKGEMRNGYCYKSDDTIFVHVNKSGMNTRTLKHEMAHAYYDNEEIGNTGEGIETSLKELYFNEPRADLYSLGIKLPK